jgi:hypothetical protein
MNTFFGAFYGYQAGMNNLGCCNTFIGSTTGGLNTTGIENTFLGTGAGEQSVIGNGNTYLGRFAGRLSTGSGNVFVGNYAGYFEQGNNRLYIDNSATAFPLLHGFFLEDSLVINGDLNIKGNLITELDESQISGVLGEGYSAVFPDELDNTVLLEITGILPAGENVLISNPVGFELDTFTLFGGTCLNPHVGYSDELPLSFETDKPSIIAAMDNWYASPNERSMSIIFKDLAGNENYRFNMFSYYPGTTSPGSGGRTSYTLHSGLYGNNSVLQGYDQYVNQAVDIVEHLGSSLSFNPATDKIVEITGISHPNFTPAVNVDYASRVITLEMSFNEGEDFITWLNDVRNGELGQSKAVSIIETTDGVTEISRENFFETLPFKYEIICGFGLNTKVVARIQLIYGCNAPG